MDPTARFQALYDLGTDVTINPCLKLHMYYKSAANLFVQAHTYDGEGQDERAFVLFVKYITLVLRKIPTHPDFKTSTLKQEHAAAQGSKCKEALRKAESLKALIKAKYQAEWDDALEAARLKENEEQEAREQTERDEAEERIRKQQPNGGECVEAQRDDTEDPFGALYERTPVPITPAIPTSTTTTTATTTTTTTTTTTATTPTAPTSTSNTPPSPVLSAPPLRHMVLPASLPDTFRTLATESTAANRETCGLLCGTLHHDVLVVTTLLLPRQTGASDSCEMMDEDAIFLYQDENELMTLGWIHTHPTQTAFLSSVDLHTHASYQLMLGEAVAVVVAPSYRTTGTFALTLPHGLRTVVDCRQPGFHPHANADSLFEEVSSRVTYDPERPLKIHDMR